MDILITGGGTREPIDGVRYLTNFSTGGTAARIADGFSRRGHRVTHVHAEGSILPDLPCRARPFVTFADLDGALRSLLAAEPFDAVIHCAAVSDYSIGSIESGGTRLPPGAGGKLRSGEEVVLRLVPNFKIVHRLLAYAAPARPRIVAFKLTHTASRAERMERLSPLALHPDIDLVVLNDLSDRLAGRPLFTLYRRLERLGDFASPATLADALAELLEPRT